MSQPLYTIAELVDLFSLPANRVVRLLAQAGVDFTLSGNRKYVAVTELEAKVPVAWGAALEVAERKAAARVLTAE